MEWIKEIIEKEETKPITPQFVMIGEHIHWIREILHDANSEVG